MKIDLNRAEAVVEINSYYEMDIGSLYFDSDGDICLKSNGKIVCFLRDRGEVLAFSEASNASFPMTLCPKGTTITLTQE